MKYRTPFFAVIAVIAALARPLPANAEISINTEYYTPSAADRNLLNRAINRLVADPRLANHPIRRFFNDPKLKVQISFTTSVSNGAGSARDKILIPPGQNLDYYLKCMAHEFIHSDISAKYSLNNNFSFLKPEDYAFQYLMEEAFATAVEIWQRLSYPEMSTDRNIRNWQNQGLYTEIADAMRNDLKATTNLSEERISAQVAAEFIHLMMTYNSSYTRRDIPVRMESLYGNCNTFLIPEYSAYAARGDALLRHMWNYLAAMMPFELPRDKGFDYYRGRFKSDAAGWANFADRPEDSIQYWMNYKYVDNAIKKLENQKVSDRRYDFLSLEDEEKLNRVMREIDPSFKPVDTSKDEWRIWQEYQQRTTGR
jgi:hypothetical protein